MVVSFIFALNRTTFKQTFANKVLLAKLDRALQMINIAQVVIVLMCQMIDISSYNNTTTMLSNHHYDDADARKCQTTAI